MKTSKEKGQSIILVTLLLFAFFAILALVLDGGFLYYMRRNAQNAADSGALAGADELCKSKSEDQAETVAFNYATSNGASSVTADATSYFGTSVGGIVEVWTEIDYQPFFARLLGQGIISPPAYAKAGCGPPVAGIGVLPVAWSCRPPNIGEDSDSNTCALQYRPEDEDHCGTFGVDNLYVIVDTDTIEDDIYCQDPPNSGLPDPGYLDCDIDNVLDGDGNYQNDVTPLSGGNRSWLDLDGGGGGASDLSDWIENGFPGSIRPHTWIAGKTGAITSVYGTVHETQLHNNVVIPVFNDICPTGRPDDLCPDQVHHSYSDPPNNIEDVIVGEAGNVDYFHIISFSYFHVECVDAGSYPGHGNNCDGHDYLVTQGQIADNVKTIEGCFVDGFTPGIGGEPGQGIDAGVYTVFLME